MAFVMVRIIFHCAFCLGGFFHLNTRANITIIILNNIIKTQLERFADCEIAKNYLLSQFILVDLYCKSPDNFREKYLKKKPLRMARQKDKSLGLY